MAIKYGRPIEARLAPVETRPAKRLDLATRPRRNRKAEWARRLVRENVLTTDDLIWPLFLVDGTNTRTPVASMPGVERLTVEQAVRDAGEHQQNGRRDLEPRRDHRNRRNDNQQHDQYLDNFNHERTGARS